MPGQVLKAGARSQTIGSRHAPSGDPVPSAEDVNTTKILKPAGDLLGMDLLDHLIIGESRYVRLKERNLGF